MTPAPPSTAREVIALAERWMGSGHKAEAIRLLQDVMAQLPPGSPSRVKVGSSLAKALLQVQREQEAELLLRSICEEDQRGAAHPFLLATTLLRQGRQREGLKWAEETIRRQPGHSEAHQLIQQLWAGGLRSDFTPSVGVIIASTGDAFLQQALRSALNQDWPEVEVWVVSDGPAFERAVDEQVSPFAGHPRLRRLTLPENTGAQGFNGHRIYGAVPWLMGTRYVCFLDEDNWFEPDHIRRMMELVLSRGLPWSFALRRLVNEAGEVLGTDDCQSLGIWPSILSDTPLHLVDFNCYLIRRDIAVNLSPSLHRRFGDGWCPDFSLCAGLLRLHPNTATPGRYTVNYRLGHTQLSAALPDFLQGNAKMAQRYPQGFPWRATT